MANDQIPEVVCMVGANPAGTVQAANPHKHWVSRRVAWSAPSFAIFFRKKEDRYRWEKKKEEEKKKPAATMQTLQPCGKPIFHAGFRPAPSLHGRSRRCRRAQVSNRTGGVA